MSTIAKALEDRYRIRDEIGRGATATVYVADDLRHSRSVAVKVLHTEISAAVGPQRFLREIEVTAQLQHPHILPLLDSGSADGLLYFVMPFVAEGTLRDRLERDTCLPIAEAVAVATEVAYALDYAHAANVIHRDIKPANILFVAGHAVVSDFGIAVAIEASGLESLTTTGLMVGTPTYASPEQAAGTGELDGRTDTYSLACVLYEMLSGEVPFHGPNLLSILTKKVTEEPTRLGNLREDVPVGIENAVSKALSIQPQDRFGTAREFTDALRQQASGELARSLSEPRREPNSVAVLPFVAVSSHADDDHLGDGICEELIHALARHRGLAVVARTSAFSFKGRSEDVRTIGQQLKASHVVEGSVRRAGDRIRISAQLVAVADGYHLWSERFDRKVDDIFVIQDEIARSIAATIKPLLGLEDESPGETGRTGIASFAAYDLYLKGRSHWSRRTADDLLASVDFMERSLDREPGFALAHAGLADALVTQALYGFAAPRDVMPIARKAVDRALAIDAHSPQALAVRGSVASLFAWDWDAAERDFDQAIRTEESYSTAHQWRAMHLLVPLQRFSEAREELQRARELDPLSRSVAVSFSAVSFYDRQYARAVTDALAALALDAQFGIAYYFMGRAKEQLGAHAEAVRDLETAVRLTGGASETRASLSHALATAGDIDRAADLLHDLEGVAVRAYVSPILLALIAVGLEDTAAAYGYLQAAVDARATGLVWLGLRPAFDGLRGDPRFDSVLHRIGLGDLASSTPGAAS